MALNLYNNDKAMVRYPTSRPRNILIRQLFITWWQLPFSAFHRETSLHPAATKTNGLPAEDIELGGGISKHNFSIGLTVE